MHDLVIRGGTVVDGTGAPARTADVTVDRGHISGVGSFAGETGLPDGRRRRAAGHAGLGRHPHPLRRPGHLGRGARPEQLARCHHRGHRQLRGRVRSGPPRPPRVADRADGGGRGHPRDAPWPRACSWEWETFPEYLDALGRRKWTMDVGTQIAHGAVRSYVMGERGARNEPATPEDIEAMKQVVKEAIAAGALGFSTSRTIAHLAIDGEPVPGTYAAEDELFGIGSALGELGTGVFELAPAGAAGEDIISPKKEMDWMRRLSAAIHRPVTFAMVQVDDAPDLWRELMEESLRAVSEGADLWPQVAGRGFGLLSGHFTTYSLFDQIPAYQELKAKGLSPDALVERPAQPRGPPVHRGVGAGPGHRRPHGPGLPHHLRPRAARPSTSPDPSGR